MSDLSTFERAEVRPDKTAGGNTSEPNAVRFREQIEIIGRREACAGAVQGAFASANIVLPCPSPSPIVAPLDGPGILHRIARDHTLFWQGERVGRGLELVEGIVRAVHLCENGERQILTFFWPGAVIEAGGGRSVYTAEAVTPCLFRQPRADGAAGAVRRAAAEAVLLQEMIDLLRGISRRCALSRIAWFLMRMRDHLPRESPNRDVLRFAVPRLDMADHLGLSLETVSRGLTELKVKRVIDLPNRKTIRFTDLRQLVRIANG